MARDRETPRPSPAPPSVLDDAEKRLRREMTRVAGALYASGGLLVLIALATRLGERVDSPVGVASVAISSIVIGIGLWLVGERVPLPASVHAITSASGTVVVSVIIVFGGEATAALFGIFYVYVGAFSFYYLPMSWAIGEVAIAGAGYAVALRAVDLPGALGVWTIIVGASITAGALIGRLGQRQRRRAASLAAYDVARATMLRIVSHDLRGPLATIIGSANTLLQRLPQLSPAAVSDLVRAQQRQAEKLLQLVEDVLATERVAAGSLRLDRDDTELRTLVDGVVGTFGEQSERVVVTGGPVMGEVDPPLLQRAIENLIGNALRHSGGRIRVDVADGDGDRIQITVSDRGDGIPEELLGSVFDPFVQSREDGGTAGLGLSLTRALVRAHGGDVTATNQSEGGAAFTITLPGTGP